MPRKDDNLLDNFEPYIGKKSAFEKSNLKVYNINLMNESLDKKNHVENMLSRCIPENGLLTNELS